MLQVGIRLVTLHGRKFVGLMLTKFEEFLSNAPKTAEYDVVRQNAVVIMGNLAKHLDAGHPKIRPTVHQLLAALSTPSEEVSFHPCPESSLCNVIQIATQINLVKEVGGVSHAPAYSLSI